ncbi:MAG: ATP-grasp domain-containing protein [Dehalococcoidia bacterium]|nr:ATP-grasp domain-containing protein [Dehalococcoidia bacterium]
MSTARTLLVLYPVVETFHYEQLALCKSQLEGVACRFVLADDCIQGSDIRVFDEIIEVPPPERLSEAYNVLRGWCDKHRPDGIFMQSEVGLLLGSLLAREFGLPGPSVEAAHLCTNKYLCRVVLSNAGVPRPLFRLAESESDVRCIAKEFGYPLVLKGVVSAMSRLVTLVSAEDQIETAVRRVRKGLGESVDILRLESFRHTAKIELGCDPRRQFLVESFVRGKPVETDGVVAGDKIITYGIVEQVGSTEPPFYIEGYLLSAEYSDPEELETYRISDKALRAVGLRDSGFSIEMRICDVETCVIEVNGRLGYDEGFWDMFQIRAHSHPLTHTLKIALGMEPRQNVNSGPCAALAYYCCYTDSIVEKLPTSEELRHLNLDGIKLCLSAREGMRIFAPPHPEAYPHIAWALVEHPLSSRKAYESGRLAVNNLGISFRPV